MDNALPHMLTKEDLKEAAKSIVNQLKSDGIFIASIRDYDKLLKEKLSYSSPYIFETVRGKNISFQTWDWNEINYKFTQYIISDEDELKIKKFYYEYRATTREELTKLFLENGSKEVTWLMPDCAYSKVVFINQ